MAPDRCTRVAAVSVLPPMRRHGYGASSADVALGAICMTTRRAILLLIDLAKVKGTQDKRCWDMGQARWWQ